MSILSGADKKFLAIRYTLYIMIPVDLYEYAKTAQKYHNSNSH